METIVNANLLELEEKLIKIEKEFDNPIDLCNHSIEEVVSTLKQLKEYILEEPFADQTEEINFFKNLKPQFSSKLIFFKKVKKLEIGKPVGSKKVLVEYYEHELQKLYSFFRDNVTLYDYYRLGNKYMDDRIFVRGQYNVCPNIDSIYFEMDHRFASSHDFQVAKILANERFQIYVENKIRILNELQPLNMAGNDDRKKLKWSLTKTNLVEIIYAFHAVGAFNNGNTDIKDIAEYFQEVFDVELGDYYGLFGEIKERKVSLTKFIDLLKEELEKKIELQFTLKR